MLTQLNDYEVARICFNLYIDFPDINHFWDNVWPFDGGYAALKRVGDIDVVVWRGSTTVYDWELNFDAIPANDPLVGGVHKGFAVGVWRLHDMISAALRGRVIVTGHSRGAAQATIFSGRLTASGKPPERLVIFGSPRPGFQKLSDILKPVHVSSYKNREDPVTDVPFNIDLIGTVCDLPYVHVRNFTKIDVKLNLADKWTGEAITRGRADIYDHHWQNYYEGVRSFVCPAIDKDLVSILTQRD